MTRREWERRIWSKYSEFYKLWSGYQIAVNNPDHIRMFHHDRFDYTQIETGSLSELIELKTATMLEF